MNVLKKIGIVVVALVILLWVISLFLPSKIQVERSVVIDAKPKTVFNQVNDLKNWEHWSPWEQRDTTMESTFKGSKSGVGAIHEWTSQESGSGSQEIVESKPHELIRTELDFGEQGGGKGYWKFEEQDGKTKVTWGMKTDMGSNPIGKYMGLFMDSMIGGDFEKGLANIKKHCEGISEQ